MRRALSVLVLTVLIASAATAQTPAGGGITGVASDEQGAAVAGVLVSAASDTVPGVYHATTDAKGAYHLSGLPPGEYLLAAELTGFATFKRGAIRVRAGLTVSVPLTMKVGAVGETVEVRAETPLLETRNGSQSVNVSGELLRSVPLTERREWYGALAVTPGVVTADFSGLKLYYVQGSDPTATLIQVDGADVTGAGKPGVTYVQLNLDSIDDIQIQTGSVSASAPLGNGGVINIATASGTNRLKGAASLFVQPKAWNGSNQPGGTSTSIDQRQLDLSLGGPIVRDRIWGFGSYRREEATAGNGSRAEFMVLHEGRIHFLGSASELLDSKDPYLQRFLYRTLPPW